MIVIGGYNSSNTCNLARICAEQVRTLHIADPACLMSRDEARHRAVGPPSTSVGGEIVSRDWLPATGPVVVGLTAGASTPNNIVGQVIRRLEQFCNENRNL
jgi:4-hydroxy-3-methylbut-2-enyl diphosphate reductase